MKTKKEPTQKIRPFAGDMELAHKIAKATNMSLIDILSLAMSAGLKAVAENGFYFLMPLKFSVVMTPPSHRIGESPPDPSPPAKGRESHVYPDSPAPSGILLNDSGEPAHSKSRTKKS